MEAVILRRQWLFVVLNILAAVSLVVMVTLFGLTGSYAPVAIFNHDRGPDGAQLIEAMGEAHHSFDIRDMNYEEANLALHTGRLVGVITIPEEFTEDVERGVTVPFYAAIDNVNVDLTDDVQRALPTAIVAFGKKKNFPGIRASVEEHDVIPHDTGYIPYLVVSALALDAMVIAGILGAMATAREWEKKTIRFLKLAPVSLTRWLAGKLLVSAALSSVSLAVTILVIVAIYGVVPVNPMATVLSLFACIVIFTCLGAWLGVLFKRTMAVVPLMFGLAMPFYIDSGALEPTRFDGQNIWILAHASPIYYAVGVLEWAFHGLHVTPEPVYVDLLVLIGIAVIAIMLTLRGLTRSRATR